MVNPYKERIEELERRMIHLKVVSAIGLVILLIVSALYSHNLQNSFSDEKYWNQVTVSTFIIDFFVKNTNNRGAGNGYIHYRVGDKEYLFDCHLGYGKCKQGLVKYKVKYDMNTAEWVGDKN